MTDLVSAVTYPDALVRRYLQQGYWTDETPLDWLANWAARKPEAPASVGGGATMSYGELHDTARRVASGLLELGFRKGDVIALQAPNVPQMMAAYCGIQMMGGVVSLHHMPYRAGELEPMFRHGGARGVVCYAGMEGYDAVATMLDLTKTLPALETVIVIGGDAPAGTVAFEDLANAEPADIADPPTAADPCAIAFTSGTSASPKAVVHPHRTLVASARSSAADFGFGDKDVVLCAPPHTHAFGLVVMLMQLSVGATGALMPAFTPPALAETVKTARATVLCCGPAHMRACMAAGLLTPGAMDSMERIFLGGSACPPDLVPALDELLPNGSAYQAWGMTEVLMGIVTPLDWPLERRADSIGTLPSGHEVRMVAEDGAVLGAGEEGEMEMRGPFLFTGYLDNPDANKTAFAEDGWFRTGDLATMEKDGTVHLTGRVKDIINRGGIKINPADVEALMDRHPAVLQSAVVPMKDEVLGERACLFVVLAPGQSLTLEDMQAHLEGNNAAKITWPERIEVIDAMPMTATRKIIKGRLPVPA